MVYVSTNLTRLSDGKKPCSTEHSPETALCQVCASLVSQTRPNGHTSRAVDRKRSAVHLGREGLSERLRSASGRDGEMTAGGGSHSPFTNISPQAAARADVAAALARPGGSIMLAFRLRHPMSTFVHLTKCTSTQDDDCTFVWFKFGQFVSSFGERASYTPNICLRKIEFYLSTSLCKTYAAAVDSSKVSMLYATSPANRQAHAIMLQMPYLQTVRAGRG